MKMFILFLVTVFLTVSALLYATKQFVEVFQSVLHSQIEGKLAD